MFFSVWEYFSWAVHLTAFNLGKVSTAVFHTEGLVCEGGEVVGKAAVIDTKHGKITKTEGKLPFGYSALQLHSLFV